MSTAVAPSVTEPYERFLTLQNDCGFGFRSQLLELLVTRSVVPGFSATTVQLIEAAQDENTSVGEFSRIISFDPALTLRCIKAATTVGAGGRNITNINQAIMYIGVKEMQRLAVSAEIMDRFSRFRVEVDWQEFWLHSILVARLAQKIAGSFKEVRGLEYLAGLLHDVGKLVLQNYFSSRFEEVIENAAETKRPHHVVEAELIGIDHAQIGAAVASAMGVHPRVLNAILFHHRPICNESIQAPMSENGFIAACVGLANAVAKISASGFQCNEEMPPLEEMDEWHYFGSFDAIAPLDIEVGEERDLAAQDLKALLGE